MNTVHDPVRLEQSHVVAMDDTLEALAHYTPCPDRARALEHYTKLAADAERLSRYRFDLMGHDWSHEFADEARAYNAGHANEKRLLAEAKEIDPDFSVWNSLCPVPYRRNAA